MSSQVSTLSSFSVTESVASDGIPIRNGEAGGEEEDELQYEWSNEGEQELAQRPEPVEHIEVVEEEILEQEVEVVEDLEDIEEVFQRRSREPSGEPGQDSEPGYDLVTAAGPMKIYICPQDDDGLPGAPLPPLDQGDLYPSQELDDSFQGIQRGEVYRHIKNIKVDSFLTACLVLSFALVVGLGVGHFLGK